MAYKKVPAWSVAVAIIIVVAIFGGLQYFGYRGQQQKKEVVIYTVPLEEPQLTICNDCHTEVFKPQIMGKKFYFGTWSLDPKFLVSEIDTIGDTISIYPDKIHLPDSLELSILVDASHGKSIEAKYIQQWAVTANVWLKLADRPSDWVTRQDVLYRIK